MTLQIGFYLRVPPELKAALKAAAEKSGRSLNAETVRRLELSIVADEDRDRAELRFRG